MAVALDNMVEHFPERETNIDVEQSRNHGKDFTTKSNKRINREAYYSP